MFAGLGASCRFPERPISCTSLSEVALGLAVLGCYVEVATLRPELYGELHQLLGVATEADNRCVEDILAEAERLMLQDGGSELPVAAGDQSPVGWGELLLPPPPAPPPPMTTKWDESGPPYHRPQRIASPACVKPFS
uniref:Uncharacterized protein n=1 Tax=Anopheles coluzzii TaxID=1518534 RepID=A0A8W7PR25_ANOCL